MTGSSVSPGVYVEIFIRSRVEEVWRLTQQPDLHRRWDLRFSDIEYLPKDKPDEPQRFLYATRIGFGLSIKGTGESTGHRSLETGESTSSLKFGSDDWKSLIRTGSGYWRYVPVEGGLRFITWYDYKVRFGSFGKAFDRLTFRPLIGWATAWSFDSLRLWTENQQSPECSLTLSLIHAIARLSIAGVWFWHGLVPKLMYNQLDERIMLKQAGLSEGLVPWIGAVEIVLALLVLWSWRARTVFLANALLMVVALAAVGTKSTEYIVAAFNPVTLNTVVIALCLIGFVAARRLPSASSCLRANPSQHEKSNAA